MDDRQRRRIFQRIKGMSNEHFWQWMNAIHSEAYFLGQKHVREAMECIPRISKTQVAAVMQKADDIRENWDGLPKMDVDKSIESFLRGEQPYASDSEGTKLEAGNAGPAVRDSV